jgi:hypothetical protein
VANPRDPRQRISRSSRALLANDLTGMWINRDVDLPQALVAAQREGSLVIFAGAGVSMGPPANVPSFEDLIVQIAGGALARRPTEPLDGYLGRVEQHCINVQAGARQFIDVETSDAGGAACLRPRGTRFVGPWRA